MYERGWSDGLPVVAPTEERVARMLTGTTRDPQDVVAVIPPNLAEATVEQVAIKSERYRYIRYADGSEEFYDHQSDPHELTNLIKDTSLAKLINAHREHLPTEFHAVLGQNSTGHKAFYASQEAANKQP